MAYSCSFNTCVHLLIFVNLAVAEDFRNSSAFFDTRKAETDALLSTEWWWWDNVSASSTSCDLGGVECNKAGRVISIDLKSTYLGDGHLRKLNFSSFPYLQKLDLMYCGLIGNIPSEIGMLSELKYLSLSDKYLTGDLPSSLGNLTQLQVLDVSQNKLNGTIPLELGSLSNLVSLDLSSNLLNGSLDFQLANLTQVTTLDVSDNSFTGSIPVFKNCSSLKYFDLSYNLLSGHIPEELGHCPSLEEVNFKHNKFTGSVPSKFLCSSHLIYLYLSNNNLFDPIPSTTLPLPNKCNTYSSGELSNFFCNAGELISCRRKSHLPVLYVRSTNCIILH